MSETVEPSGLEKQCLESVVPNYALLFFDHLFSEYLALKTSIDKPEVITALESIRQRRDECKLTWSDIYTFDLTLVHVRPAATLIRKAYDARARYRSIAGQKEYDEYVASNPPNLIEIKVAPNAEPPQPDVIVENALRADVEYLLSKFYLYYATLPARERLRDDLTKKAVRRTLVFVAILGILIIANLGILFGFNLDITSGLTVLTVALAGTMGGCVSMLQRIQSTPSEGDALFNLAALNNGWTGLSLSPLYGGIFASLLFVLFAAGVLKGSVFPEIHTPGKSVLADVSAPSQPESQSPSSANLSATRESTVEVLRIKTFLTQTGPVDGVSYALLIVWSFLAGFAERLVPDTLNRLVTKNEAIQGSNG
jgi:hypothetical protein